VWKKENHEYFLKTSCFKNEKRRDRNLQRVGKVVKGSPCKRVKKKKSFAGEKKKGKTQRRKD